MLFTKRMLCLFLLFLFTFSCKKKKEEPKIPHWFPVNSHYQYDYYGVNGDTIKKYINLFVSKGIPDNSLFFGECFDTLFNNPSNLFDFYDEFYYNQSDGLCKAKCEDCPHPMGILGCWKDFHFTYIPCFIKDTGKIIQYGCGHNITGYHTVINPDTTITVPFGSFKTFQLKQENGDISYWNEDIGIIRYDKQDTISKEFGVLKLSSFR